MVKQLVALVGVSLLVVGCASFGASPQAVKQVTGRTTLPELSEGDITPLICPTGVVFKVGFDEKDDRYALMFFGDADEKDGKYAPKPPYVWIRFEGSDPVAVLLVDVGGKPQVITMDELKAKYPDICSLLGTAV